MVAFIGGLFIFLAIHSVRIFAPQVRERFIGRFGDNGWKVGYSLVSLFSLIWLVSGYPAAKTSLGFVWTPPVWTSHIAIVLMLVALILVVAAYVPSKLKARIKHPMLAGVKVWALAHLLANGLGVHLVLFGSILAWAVLDRIAVKRRGGADPFAPSGWGGDIIAVGVGTLAWVILLLWGHQWLFGVAPIG